MSDFDYEQIDPGIRDTVRLLRDAGFETTDSGDGVSKPDMVCALDFPHVAAVCAPHLILAEAKRMAEVLEGTGFVVQATYDPRDVIVVLFAAKYGVSDG